MAHHDEMIWQIINTQFCSFKTTFGTAHSDKTDFCRHPYSVTGLCNRGSCPLANSRYAVVREQEGKVSLYIKTAERAHSPKNMWEQIHLSRNYDFALKQLDEHLAYFPKTLVHRNKQRLTKIYQMLIRMRKLKLKERDGKKVKLVGVHRKVEQREERREKKALVAAKIEDNIEKELVERLAKGAYGDIYNFEENEFQKAMEKIDETEDMEEEEEEYDSQEEEGERIVEYVEDLQEDEEEEEEEEIKMGFSEEEEEISSDESVLSDDDEDSYSSRDNGVKKDDRIEHKKRKGARIEIEYEDEEDDNEIESEQVVTAGMAW